MQSIRNLGVAYGLTLLLSACGGTIDAGPNRGGGGGSEVGSGGAGAGGPEAGGSGSAGGNPPSGRALSASLVGKEYWVDIPDLPAGGPFHLRIASPTMAVWSRTCESSRSVPITYFAGSALSVGDTSEVSYTELPPPPAFHGAFMLGSPPFLAIDTDDEDQPGSSAIFLQSQETRQCLQSSVYSWLALEGAVTADTETTKVQRRSPAEHHLVPWEPFTVAASKPAAAALSDALIGSVDGTPVALDWRGDSDAGMVRTAQLTDWGDLLGKRLLLAGELPGTNGSVGTISLELPLLDFGPAEAALDFTEGVPETLSVLAGTARHWPNSYPLCPAGCMELQASSSVALRLTQGRTGLRFRVRTSDALSPGALPSARVDMARLGGPATTQSIEVDATMQDREIPVPEGDGDVLLVLHAPTVRMYLQNDPICNGESRLPLYIERIEPF